MTRRKHQNKEIEKAIQFAEKHGWSVRKASGAAHPFGVLKCPHYDKKCRCGVYCQASIWGTPKTPAAHARKLLRGVKKCIYFCDSGND